MTDTSEKFMNGTGQVEQKNLVRGFENGRVGVIGTMFMPRIKDLLQRTSEKESA